MRDQKLSLKLTVVLAILSVTVLMAGRRADAQTEKILENFQNNGLGDAPAGGLIFDGAGNLYGTTSAGGAYSQGTVFELSPKSGGGWTMNVLHSFGNGTDGQSPWGGKLVMDASGNLYGTTRYGGTSMCDSYNPDGSGNLYGTTFVGGKKDGGTVYELSPATGGSWTETILHNFYAENGADGYDPLAGLVLDSKGNLYGTTENGGKGNLGTVFEITP